MTARTGAHAHPAVRCAAAAQARGDLLAGTAPRVDRWFLVEQPGPWGRDPLVDSGLPPGVGAALARAAAAAGMRLQLVRRPGRATDPALRRWVLADARPGRESVRWGDCASAEDLPAALVAASADEAVGTPSRQALYLVCAHSRHDACCAVRGRPVAHALARARPEQVWESTHLGGCRFAAGVVVLPHGLYYGHVPAEDVLALAEAHDAGRVVPAALRGRSAFEPAVQAAQAFARAATGLDGLDALAPVAATTAADGARVVRLSDGARVHEVAVRRVAVGEPAALTCAAARLQPPPAYELVGLRMLDAGAAPSGG